MAHYIDKSALVAEIKRILSAFENSDAPIDRLRASILIGLLSFINTLEVREVDLEKELDTWRHNHFHGRRDKDANGEYLERSSQLDIAKHFFELGIKAQKGE